MEITTPPRLDPRQSCLLELHSIVNVLNLVRFELENLQQLSDAVTGLPPLHHKTLAMLEALGEPGRSSEVLRDCAPFSHLLLGTLDTLARTPALSHHRLFLETRDNLRVITEVLTQRAGELLGRLATPDTWLPHAITTLHENFSHFLHAVERNSHGHYRIVRNLAEHELGDYLVHLDFSSPDGHSLLMPAVFQDVMRDLLANARKYTPPGGSIRAGLADNGDGIRLVVEDNGCGIPPSEIEHVTEFGHRGANVLDHPTRGGGFGLTKALASALRHGGRLWIDSPPPGVPQGTRIELRVPRPPSASSTKKKNANGPYAP